MKKTIALFSAISLFLILVVPVLAQESQGNKIRYLVKSQNRALKALLGVRHNFDNGFTTELNRGQEEAFKRLVAKFGVETEEVPQYHLLGKPVCGDHICQGHERKTCPADCPSEPSPTPTPTPEPERQCYPDDPSPWGVEMVNAGSGGAGINVAVLDTGVKTDHLDLDVKVCKDATKRGIRDGCNDSVGHGTHVAGTIAANGGSDGKGISGVAPEANLWAVKVCGPSGCWTDDIAAAIRYVSDEEANVINLSLGGDTESLLVRDAIDYAVGKKVLVVAASGNDGPVLGSIDYPAANPLVLAVGAIDEDKVVAGWSSRGINNGDYMIEEREVEFGAPGVDVESTDRNGCYSLKTGTSMATPHVVGLAAKLWQGSADSTRTYLQSIASDIWDAGDDPATGFGLPIAP